MKNTLENIVRGNAQKNIVGRLNEHLFSMSRMSRRRYLITSVIVDKHGIIISSTNEGLIGPDVSDKNEFIQGMRMDYGNAYVGNPRYSPYLHKRCFCISAPFISEIDDEPVGVIINAYSLSALNTITTNRTGMGNSGEMYLVDSDLLMQA